MKISFVVVDGVLISRFEGDIDIQSKKAIIDSYEFSPPYRDMVFDLCSTRYMDSSGLGTLVDLARRIQESGNKVVFAFQNPLIAKVMHITSLNRVLQIADSVEKAIILLRSGRSYE